MVEKTVMSSSRETILNRIGNALYQRTEPVRHGTIKGSEQGSGNRGHQTLPVPHGTIKRSKTNELDGDLLIHHDRDERGISSKTIEMDRKYTWQGHLEPEERTAMFAEKVGEYRANATVTGPGNTQENIRRICGKHQVKKLVVPSGFPEGWLPGGVELLKDEAGILSNEELDNSGAVLTGCSLAIAQTGTLVLDGGPGQGRRVLTLLPDLHICVVRSDQIVEVVPEAFERLHQSFTGKLPQITFISGPSATSDIELSRVEGVHGPRRLEVLIISNGAYKTMKNP
jgi:L-lactate dehydrogenase complex protein LldG